MAYTIHVNMGKKLDGFFLLKSNTGLNNRSQLSDEISFEVSAGVGVKGGGVFVGSDSSSIGHWHVSGGWVREAGVSAVLSPSAVPRSLSGSTPPSRVSYAMQAREKCPILPQE